MTRADPKNHRRSAGRAGPSSRAGRLPAVVHSRSRAMNLQLADLPPRNLPRGPPLTPAGVLLRCPWTLPAIVLLFVAMAFAAAIANGALLRVWDEPVRSFISGHRVDWLGTFFLYVTRAGSVQVV